LVNFLAKSGLRSAAAVDEYQDTGFE